MKTFHGIPVKLIQSEDWCELQLITFLKRVGVPIKKNRLEFEFGMYVLYRVLLVFCSYFDAVFFYIVFDFFLLEWNRS